MKVTLFLSTRQNQCRRTGKKKKIRNLSIKSIEWLVRASEIQHQQWSPGQLMARSVAYHCFFFAVIQAALPEKKKPADFLEGRLHQQSGETHLTVPPPPPCPLCFTAARGITAPKSFFPAAALGYGKKGIEIPEDFWVHSMWKAAFALPSAPLLHVLSSSRLRFPLTSRCWSLLLSLFLLYWLVPSDSDLRLWVWSHADSSFFFSALTVLPCLLGVPLAALVLHLLYQSLFLVDLRRFFPNILIFELPKPLKM